MLVKIIVGGRYSDFKKQPGFVRSQILEADAVVDLPGEYGLGLIESELAEAIEEIEPAFAILEAIQAEEGAKLVEPSEGPKVINEITDTAKKLLDKHKLDPTDVTGTGKGGKITLRDANKYVADFLAVEKEKVKAYLAEREANEA